MAAETVAAALFGCRVEPFRLDVKVLGSRNGLGWLLHAGCVFILTAGLEERRMVAALYSGGLGQDPEPPLPPIKPPSSVFVLRLLDDSSSQTLMALSHVVSGGGGGGGSIGGWL